MKTGLYFGSFNPIHIGHMAIANYMLEFTDIDQIMFVVSPRNPLKEKNSLLKDYHRLEMVQLAVGDEFSKYKVSNIEFDMPQPSYTVDTLAHLSEKYPDKEFALIMGSDNLRTFHKWKNFEYIIKKYTRYVYPRPETAHLIEKHSNVVKVDAPQMEISASFIRNAIKEGKDIRYFLPEKVWEYISEMHFYEK